MNPVQAPHDIGGKVKSTSVGPIPIYIITQVFHHFGDLVGTYWLVLATANFDAGRSPISGIRAYSLQCYPMKIQQL
jgi:hypothetical protein